MQIVLLFLAIAAYAVTAGLCALAARRAGRIAAGSRDAAIWQGCVAAFAALVVVRFFGLEELVRSSLRSVLRSSGDYAGRWEVQAPLASAIVILGGALVFATFRLWPGPRQHPFYLATRMALIAALWFLPLLGLRLVSFHATDWLLYYGPVRLNWVIDGGLTAIVAACAAYYAFATLPERGKRPPPREEDAA